ncbi:MAG: crotonobetainyl-CoA--carnitine CoA-transferase [Candidatus Riflebacteria bacterium]|nr:crotonobetainyl-CoA--carnitine CoA-transferase [Candidatus Riflebacteria bacterium]
MEQQRFGELSSDKESNARANFFELFKNCPIPDNELLANLGLFIKRQSLSRILFMHDLYKKILPIHGNVIEFGCRWGQNLALFSACRGMYEPFNYCRKIIGFDTFEGFPSVCAKDGTSEYAKKGTYKVTAGYADFLNKVLAYHEEESPVSHIKKFELVKGDASVEIEKYLKDNPETIVAMAYFDFDIYEPTKTCLNAIKGHLTKGSVIGFDELNCKDFPGETLAVKEVFGLDKYSIRHDPNSPSPSYIVIE